MRWKELCEDDRVMPKETPVSTAEQKRLLQLAKAKGLDLSPPTLTPEQIIQAGNAPAVARMLVTAQTTPAEISAFLRGKRHG